MKTESKFVIEGIDPAAKNIFALEAMSKKQIEEFEKKHKVYLCRNANGIFFSKKMSDAFVFDDEDTACSVIDGLNSKRNLRDCEWNQILLEN
jgi:hypothetical protein